MKSSSENPVRKTAFKGALAQEVFSRIDFNQQIDVLEIGCGNGWLSYELSYKVDGSVTGIDINSKAILEANNQRKKENCNFLVLDATNQIFEKKFDYIVSINAFHHLSNRKKAVQKMKSALKENGELIIVDFCGDSIFMKLLDKLSLDHKGSIHFLDFEEFTRVILEDFPEAQFTRKTISRLFPIMVCCAKK